MGKAIIHKHPHVNLANRYARDVVSGKIPACQHVVGACRRQIDDLERWKKADSPYYFDKEKAEKVCNFIENLPHVKGEWAKRRENIRLEPWQCFGLTTIFGWMRRKDNTRRFREVYWAIPRKNSKSTLAAGIGLYMFAADEEAGAEVYSGATTEKQAWEVFGPARLMAKKAEGFVDYYGIHVGAKNLSIQSSASKFEPVIGKPGDGSSPHCAIVDEYHEHSGPELFDTMATGMGARLQPLLVVITTAGTNTSGPCYEKETQAKRILERSIENNELFSIIYTVDDDDKWENFDIWIKANPNYGVSVYEDFLKSRHVEAMQNASRQNIILCKHLNRWMNAGQAWMNMLKWQECEDPGLEIDFFSGQPVWLGLDLASKIDICALMMITRYQDGFAIFGRYYIPEECANLPENSHYRAWAANGEMIITDGARTDFMRIEDDIREISEKYAVESLSFDPREANYLIQQVQSWSAFDCIEIPQGPAHMSEPMKEMEALIYSRAMKHDGDPVLKWMMGNTVRKEARGGGQVKYYYPTKERNSNKIDGVVAGIMALSRAMLGDESSVYESRGVLAF